MNNQRLTSCLLAVIAVLLVLHLVKPQPREAHAGPVVEEPRVIDVDIPNGIGVLGTHSMMVRTWSDGSVDYAWLVMTEGDPFTPNICRPVVGVDWCDFIPMQQGVPFQAVDVNHDGCIDASDLAQVLGSWQSGEDCVTP